MIIAFLNGNFLPKDDLRISPDDRGFLFADGIYEVVRWYQGWFYDMEGHMARLKRSLREIRLDWTDVDTFPIIGLELIKNAWFRSCEKRSGIAFAEQRCSDGKHHYAHPYQDKERQEKLAGRLTG